MNCSIFALTNVGRETCEQNSRDNYVRNLLPFLFTENRFLPFLSLVVTVFATSLLPQDSHAFITQIFKNPLVNSPGYEAGETIPLYPGTNFLRITGSVAAISKIKLHTLPGNAHISKVTQQGLEIIVNIDPEAPELAGLIELIYPASVASDFIKAKIFRRGVISSISLPDLIYPPAGSAETELPEIGRGDLIRIVLAGRNLRKVTLKQSTLNIFGITTAVTPTSSDESSKIFDVHFSSLCGVYELSNFSFVDNNVPATELDFREPGTSADQAVLAKRFRVIPGSIPCLTTKGASTPPPPSVSGIDLVPVLQGPLWRRYRTRSFSISDNDLNRFWRVDNQWCAEADFGPPLTRPGMIGTVQSAQITVPYPVYGVRNRGAGDAVTPPGTSITVTFTPVPVIRLRSLLPVLPGMVANSFFRSYDRIPSRPFIDMM